MQYITHIQVRMQNYYTTPMLICQHIFRNFYPEKAFFTLFQQKALLTNRKNRIILVLFYDKEYTYMPPSISLLIAMVIISIIALALYGIDKAKAKKHLWRIPESVLLVVGFFGGAIGALVAMRLFHHKTNHWYFWVVNVLGLAFQVALVIFLSFD